MPGVARELLVKEMKTTTCFVYELFDIRHASEMFSQKILSVNEWISDAWRICSSAETPENRENWMSIQNCPGRNCKKFLYSQKNVFQQNNHFHVLKSFSYFKHPWMSEYIIIWAPVLHRFLKMNKSLQSPAMYILNFAYPYPSWGFVII